MNWGEIYVFQMFYRVSNDHNKVAVSSKVLLFTHSRTVTVAKPSSYSIIVNLLDQTSKLFMLRLIRALAIFPCVKWPDHKARYNKNNGGAAVRIDSTNQGSSHFMSLSLKPILQGNSIDVPIRIQRSKGQINPPISALSLCIGCCGCRC